MHDDLQTQRQQIDQIDAQLVRLLSERARAAVAIGKIKKQAGTPVYDPSREGEVLERITALNKGPLDKGAVEEVFATIMSVCRQIQIP